MTFIELVRAVRSRIGMSGTGPASISGAMGAEVDLVNVVSDAYTDIQNSREDWLWLRDRVTFNTVVGTTTYTPTTIFGSSAHRLGRWKKDSFYFLDGSTKRYVENYVDYDTFTYRHINDTVNQKISEFSIRPQDDALCINRPNSVYAITIDYQKRPQMLTIDSSTPEMPSHFHLLIVYEAIAKYCAAVSSPELYDKYSYDHAKLYGALQRRYLPKKELIITGIA